MSEHIIVEVDGDIATVTLDKPERRNSQTPKLWRELAEIGADLVERVRVVIVRGNGDAFSAGLDRALLTGEGIEGEQSIPALMAESDEVIDDVIDQFQRGFRWLHDPRIVSIAAVQGYAIGGGFQLALACDIRVVADDVQFCMKEPALGIVPDLGGTHPLVAAIGYSRALEICATARYVGAQESVSTGLAVAAVPRAELDDTARTLANAILESSAGAVRETKWLLTQAADNDLDDQRALERTAQLRRFEELRGGSQR